MGVLFRMSLAACLFQPESQPCSNQIWILATMRWRQRAEADRREVDPPIEVQRPRGPKAGQLEWWVKDRQGWWGWVRGADSRQRWIGAVDLRPASGSLSHTRELPGRTRTRALHLEWGHAWAQRHRGGARCSDLPLGS